MFRLISKICLLIIALGANNASAADIVLPISTECALKEGRYALSLSLSRDNIESNKRAIFSGSYLGEFDSQAEAASALRPEEMIQDSIKRRGLQILELSQCLQKQANDKSIPRLTEKKIDLKPYQVHTREDSDQHVDNKAQLTFSDKIQELENSLKSKRWEQAFFQLKFLQKLTQNSAMTLDQSQLANISQLEKLKTQYLPDGVVNCHQDWQLVFKAPRQSPFGSRLRHFANKLCLHPDKKFVQRALAGLILLDHFAKTHETEIFNQILYLDLASDEIQLKAIIKILLGLPEAIKLQKVANEAATIADSKVSSEWIDIQLKNSLDFYSLSDNQRITATNLFREYSL